MEDVDDRHPIRSTVGVGQALLFQDLHRAGKAVLGKSNLPPDQHLEMAKVRKGF